MMHRIIRSLMDVVHRPIAHAVSYVEPDGTVEVDIKDCSTCANTWADWCKQEGCTEVEISPLYTEREMRSARLRRPIRTA